MVHRYAVTVAGKERAVEVEDLGGGQMRVAVDGRARVIDARQVEPGVWSLVEPATGRAVAAQIDGEMPSLTVDIGGLLIAAEVVGARAAGLAALAHRTTASGGGPAVVRSPMPGRVVRVHVKPGDRVTAGQGVAVVEAMKMENELRAPRDGAVRDVRCREGAAVESGEELLVIE